MKQLELTVTITKDNNYYELIATPLGDNSAKLTTYCKGNTEAEVINMFLNRMTDFNVRYWFILKDI
jgi:hypothetical protein